MAGNQYSLNYTALSNSRLIALQWRHVIRALNMVSIGKMYNCVEFMTCFFIPYLIRAFQDVLSRWSHIKYKCHLRIQKT